MTSEIKISNITNREGTSGSMIVGVTSSIGTGYAKIPSGNNSERVGIESGSLRYNNTAKLLEFYDGTEWKFILPAEESANALGVFGGGYNFPETSVSNLIDYITISTLGDTQDFGNLSQSRCWPTACSSTTRGLFGGGYTMPGYVAVNTIDYVTISITGNAQNFSDLSLSRMYTAPCSSNVRGIWAGGSGTLGSPSYNIIDYVTIATLSNATDFGDLTSGNTRFALAGCSSSTRGVFAGGDLGGGVFVNTIDYITIATIGNATNFADLTFARGDVAGCSSSTRGVFLGALISRSPSYTNRTQIDYITIASDGVDSSYFGDLHDAVTGTSCSSSTRGVFGNVALLQYFTIATKGNVTFFGTNKRAYNYNDIYSTRIRYGMMACSNNHGGLL